MREKQNAYLETKRPPKTDTALASSIIEHWQARHLYGKAVVITQTPENLVKLTKKRWLTVIQSLQQERSRTVDADRLLTLTHSITRMQQMIITSDAPFEYPAAHFWCVAPEKLINLELPRSCRTLYVATHLKDDSIEHVGETLPAYSLVVDYTSTNHWLLQSKEILEEKVHHAWSELEAFLEHHSISIKELVDSETAIDPIDDALDILLDNSSSFLRHTRQFQEVLHLAQPLALSHTTKQQYGMAAMLARRVTLLTPSLLHHSFIQAENDSFSLYDNSAPKLSRESLTFIVARHIAAGRHRLASALERAFVNNLPVV